MMLVIMIFLKVMLSSDNESNIDFESLRLWRVWRAFQLLQLCGRSCSLRLQLHICAKGVITPQGGPAGHPLKGPRGSSLLGVQRISIPLECMSQVSTFNYKKLYVVLDDDGWNNFCPKVSSKDEERRTHWGLICFWFSKFNVFKCLLNVIKEKVCKGPTRTRFQFTLKFWNESQVSTHLSAKYIAMSLPTHKKAISFLAGHNSSIGDLVTDWLTHSVTFTFDITEWP